MSMLFLSLSRHFIVRDTFGQLTFVVERHDSNSIQDQRLASGTRPAAMVKTLMISTRAIQDQRLAENTSAIPETQ